MNLAFSNTSPFYKKYRQHKKVYDESFLEEYAQNDKDLFFYLNYEDWEINRQLKHSYCDDSEYLIRRFEKEEREEKALAEIHNLEWYESEMVKLYCNVGTYRGMQRATLIPVKSCHDAVRGAIAKIKQRI